METERLIIRTFEPKDAKAWVAMLQDEDVLRYLPPGPTITLGDFEKSLERRLANEREHGYAMWAVDLKANGAFIGQCGLYLSEGKGPELELAYHYKKTAWGNGYASEAAAAVMSYAFTTLGLECVIGFTFPGNLASQRVLEKAGMHFEGTGTYYDIPDLRKYVADRDTRDV